MKRQMAVCGLLLGLICGLSVFGGQVPVRGADQALRFALGAFNQVVPESLHQREVNYIRDELLTPEQCAKVVELYGKRYPSADEKAKVLQEAISGFMPIGFVTMKNKTTYWASATREQNFDFAEFFSGLKGKVKGEDFEMSLDQMRRELKSIELPLDYSGGAILTQRDGNSFVVTHFHLYAKGNGGSWYCSYKYRNPVNNRMERKVIFGSDDYDPTWRQIRRIVFGLQQPKMNFKTHKIFPSDYRYDPFTKTPLIPVKWSGPVHLSQ
jgi:hypothetical protein